MHPSQYDQVAFIPKQNLCGTIQPPGSKSISNRALICAAMGKSTCVLDNMLISEDTEVMIHAWQQLGVEIELDHLALQCRVRGCNASPPKRSANIFVANSGTTIRFLTSALAACEGEFVLDGIERMRNRPIDDLIEALTKLGVDIRSINSNNPSCPPLKINSQGLPGGHTTIAGNVSSQFLSSLLMASPYAHDDMEIELSGELVSKPYVEMTIAVMQSFGVQVQTLPHGYRVRVPQTYATESYTIEPDASAASYYLAAAAMTEGEVTITGLGSNSLQGDVHFAHVLGQMGCDVSIRENSIHLIGKPLHGIDLDMGPISDTVQTLAAVALFASGETRVRGVAHNRFKETDRIGDLASELRKVGAVVEEFDDGLKISPRGVHGATLETYNDHRMAMSLALIGLKTPNVWVKNPSCTAKTYPDYFLDMQTCFGLELRLQ